VSRLLGDNEGAGQLVLGEAGRPAIGPQASPFRGAGGALKITRDRMRPAISATALIARPPSGGGGSGGNPYQQER
jgi:hypothetical protein